MKLKSLLVFFVFLGLCRLNSFAKLALYDFVDQTDTIRYAGKATICKGGTKILEFPFADPEDNVEWLYNHVPIPDAKSITYVATKAGQYDAIITKPGQAPKTSNALTLKEIAVDFAEFTFPAGVSCPDIPIVFTDLSLGAVIWNWDFGDPNSHGANTSDQRVPSHTFVGVPGNGTQDFNVKLIVTNAEGCKDTLVKKVTTNRSPDATINDFVSTKAFTNCQTGGSNDNFTLTITNSSTTKATNDIYKIDWGDNSPVLTTGTFDKLTHIYTERRLFLLKVTVIGKNGCQATRVQEVFNGSNPAVPYSNPGGTVGCGPYTLLLPIDKNVKNTPGTKYTLFFSDGTSDTTSTPPDTIKHTFNKSSCGFTTVGGFKNAFYVRIVAENPCGTSAITIEPIYVSTKPTAKFTNSSDNICVNTTLSLNDTSISGAVVSNNSCVTTVRSNWEITPALGWTINGKLGIINPSNDPDDWGSKNLNVKFAIPGEYIIRLTTINNCGTDYIEKKICVNPPPTANFDLDKTEGCGPLVVKAINKSNTPTCGNNTYQWNVVYSNPQSCSGASSSFSYINRTSSTSANPEFQFNNAGVYSISLTTKNAEGTGCTVTSAIQKVSVKTKPIITSLNIQPNSCVGANRNFSATIINCYATTETYIWTFTGANIASSTDKFPTNITYANAGTFPVKVEITNECGTTMQTGSIDVKAAPAITPISDKVLCRGAASGLINFSNVGNVSGVSYSWTRTNEAIGSIVLSGSLNSISSFTATNNTNSILTSTFTVTPTLNGCSGLPIIFKISVNPSSPTANAGADQKLCNQTEVTLNGNDPGNFTGIWTQTAGPSATFQDANKFNTKVTGLTAGQDYKFTWTIAGVDPCPATSDEVTIYNRPEVTTSKAGDDVEVCDYTVSPASGNSIVLQANKDATRTYETGTWSVVSKAPNSNPVFSSTTANNATFRNLIPGEYELKWTISNDAGCTSSSDNIKIIVFAKPSAGTISAATSICYGTDVVLTNANAVGEIVGWEYREDINGMWISIPDSKKASITDPNVKVTRYYRIKIKSEGSVCNSEVYGNKTVIVDPLSVGGTSSGSNTTCAGVNSGKITLSGQVGTVTSWQKSSDDIQFTDIPNSAGNFYDYSNLTATTFFRAVVKSGNCNVSFSTSSKITLTAQVDLAAAGADQAFCEFVGKIKLDANTPINGIGKWKQISGPSITFIDDKDPKTEVDIANNGTYVFEWEINNGVCAPSKDEISVFNYPKLVNKISGSAMYCFGQPISVTGENPTGGDGNYIYSWEKSADNLAWDLIPNENSYNLTVGATADTYFRRIVKGGPCSQTSDPVLIKVLPAISNNSVAQSQDLCIGKPIALLTGSTPTGGNGNFIFSWEKSNDKQSWSVIPNSTDKDYQPLNLLTDIYFRRIVTSAECKNAQQSLSNIVEILIRPDAIADFTASKNKSCIPFNLAEVITINPHDNGNGSFEWFANGERIGTGSTFPGYIITKDGDEVKIKLVTTSKFGCEPATKEIVFTTTKNVKASFTKDKQKDCGPMSVNFVNTSEPLNGATYFWDFGNGKTSSVSNPPAVIFDPHPLGKDTTYYISLTAKTDCSETILTDSVTVRAKPQSIFSPDITIGCSPLEVNFTNQSRGIPNNYTYDFGDGEQLQKDDNSPITHTYYTTKTDTVTVKLYAENECGIDSSSYQIVIYPNTIKAELVVDGNKTFGCAPFNVKFYNNSEGASAFKWDFNDGSTATSSASPATLEHLFKTSGIYTVKLTGTNGCSTASTTETITVYEQPEASFKINKLQYCIGKEVLFTNTSSENFTFVWDFSDGVTSNEINAIHKFTQAGDFVVKLNVFQTFPDGTTCSSVTSQTISVIPQPIATFNSNADVLNCAPFTVKVNTTPANASGGVEWDFGDIDALDNISQGYQSSHTYTKPGVYLIKSIAYNKTGCVDSTQQIIRITESPVADFETIDTLICGNAKTVSFVNKTTYSGAGSLGYKWFVNNALISTVKDFTYSFNVASSVILPYVFEVKLVAQSTIGCPDTVIHKIQFNPLPKADFVLTQSIGCVPFSLAAKNKSIYGDGFKWYLDGVLVSTDVEPNGLVLDVANKTYKLKMVASNIYGCKLDSIEKQLDTYPQPKAVFAVSDSVSCNGRLDLRTNNQSTGATRYLWNFGDATPESNLANPSHIYGIAGIYKLTLVAYNIFCSDTSYANIRIANVPKAAFKANKTNGCTKLEVVFENLSDNAISYLWDFGDGSFSTSKNPTHNYTYQNSPFNVKLIAVGEFGCSDTTIKTNFINVATPPKANFEILPDSVIKIPDYTFNFKNTSVGNPVKFLWDFGNGKTSNLENPSYTYPDTGLYKIRLVVTNSEGCTDTLIRSAKIDGVPGYLFIPNAFEPGSKKEELRTFKVRGSGIASYEIKIFNKWGEQIWESSALNEDGEPTGSWDGIMHGLPAQQGVYIWSAYAKFIDGSEWKGMKYFKGGKRTTGAIHLIR